MNKNKGFGVRIILDDFIPNDDVLEFMDNNGWNCIIHNDTYMFEQDGYEDISLPWHMSYCDFYENMDFLKEFYSKEISNIPNSYEKDEE